jgi:hypothetical protein
MDLKIETVRLARDRVAAGINDMRAITRDQVSKRSMDDLTASNYAAIADQLETAVALLNETVLSRIAKQKESDT